MTCYKYLTLPEQLLESRVKHQLKRVFDCGKPSLDNYIRTISLSSIRKKGWAAPIRRKRTIPSCGGLLHVIRRKSAV